MKCQNAKIYKYSFLIGLLLCTLAGQADPVRYCREYDVYTKECPGGSITAARGGDDCHWILTAEKAEGSNFEGWDFDSDYVQITDGTKKSLTVTIEITDLGLDTLPVSAKFRYTVDHCKSCRDFQVYANVPHIPSSPSSSSYGQIVPKQTDTCWQMTAVPNPGHYFVQWSDGTASNPRTIDLDSINKDTDTITYTAFFAPGAERAKIDQWKSDSIQVTTTKSQGALAGATTYYARVYFDGELVGSYAIQKKDDDGVYKFKFNASKYKANTLAGKKCHIVFINGKTCGPIGVVDTIIPYIVNGSEKIPFIALNDASDPRTKYGVHVLAGGKATFEQDIEIADLNVYEEGKAVIKADVTAGSVIMRADVRNSTISELLVESGSLSASSLYYDCAVDLLDYYGFSLPGTVNTNAAKYRSGASAVDYYGLDWYNGANRAAGTRAWEEYYDGSATKSINIGTGYNIFALAETWDGTEGTRQNTYGAHIRFPLSINPASPQSDIEVKKHSSEVKANKNWNLIGLPYMSSYQGPINMLDKDENVLEELNYIIYTDDNFRTYPDPVHPSDFVMKPVQAYFVQVVDGTKYLRFDTPVAGRTYAPRRGIKAVNDKLAAGIMLTQADNSDRAGLLIGEKYTNDYDINADLAKMFGSNQGLAVFALSGSQKLAYIALPPAEGNGISETVIPLGYNQAAMGQEMTFAFDEDRYPSVRFDERIQALELIDYVEGSTTNLLQEPYTCTAYEKADNARFALAIRYTKTGANVTTGICDDVAASKVNDGIYDLMGRRVNADDARSLGAGVYIIMENGKARKEVIR